MRASTPLLIAALAAPLFSLPSRALQSPPTAPPAEPPMPTALPGPVPVWCGSVECFSFRVAAVGKSPEERANHVMVTLNKYLGGKVARIAVKPLAPKSPILRMTLNDEFLAHITPEDAAAEKQKTPALLAARWTKRLTDAFNATRAIP